jgi:hypothetical protein
VSKVLQITTVVGIFLVAAGCRTPDPSVELLESELRWLEDNLYSLDDQLERCCEQLASAQRNNDVLRKELAAARRPSSEARPTEAPDRGPPAEDEFDLSPPVVEYGQSDSGVDAPRGGGIQGNGVPPGDAPAPIPADPRLREPKIEVPDSTPPPLDPSAVENALDDYTTKATSVQEIHLNERLTGGYDFDGRPGHEGVLVVVEPRNKRGDYVDVPGELTVEVRDPTKSGLEARVGKWSYNAAESAAFLRESLLGRGLHLRLPWPATPPESDRLSLSVAFATVDGRELRAERTIQVRNSPPVAGVPVGTSAHAANWTPGRLPASEVLPAGAPPIWSPTRRR